MTPLLRDPPLDPDYFCPICSEAYPYCDCPSAGDAEVLEQAGRAVRKHPPGPDHEREVTRCD